MTRRTQPIELPSELDPDFVEEPWPEEEEAPLEDTVDAPFPEDVAGEFDALEDDQDPPTEQDEAWPDDHREGEEDLNWDDDVLERSLH